MNTIDRLHAAVRSLLETSAMAQYSTDEAHHRWFETAHNEASDALRASEADTKFIRRIAAADRRRNISITGTARL